MTEQLDSAVEQASLKGHYTFTLTDIRTGKVRVFEYDNIVPLVGRTLFANNLTSDAPTNSMKMNKAAIGTGQAAPANSDVKLQTEVYRNEIASSSNDNNIAYGTAFFNATEVTGAFKEAGIFCNGTSAANSGVLLSRVAINISKTNSDAMTLDWVLTIN